MLAPHRLRASSKLASLVLSLATLAAPGSLAAATQARLVHCGEQTCLRISGHRPHSAVVVRIAGHELGVEGGHSWRATVPLATARDGANASGDTLMVTLADTQTSAETVEAVALPPGALGRRVELASLVVRAH